MAGKDVAGTLFRIGRIGARWLGRHYAENPQHIGQHARIAGKVADAAGPVIQDAAARALDAARPAVQDAAATTRRRWRTFLRLPQGARIAWRKQHGSESQQEEHQ